MFSWKFDELATYSPARSQRHQPTYRDCEPPTYVVPWMQSRLFGRVIVVRAFDRAANPSTYYMLIETNDAERTYRLHMDYASDGLDKLCRWFLFQKYDAHMFQDANFTALVQATVQRALRHIHEIPNVLHAWIQRYAYTNDEWMRCIFTGRI